MYVLSVRQGSDLAGSSYAIAKAFASHPTITVRSAVRSTNYLDYPHDLAWSQLTDEWPHADVVHLHENAKPRRILGDKPFVMHLHGTVFRRNVDLFRRYIADNGGVGVAATLDLLDLEPSLTWLPHPISPDMLPKRRVTGGRRLRVAHAPTNRAIKSTEAFLTACRLVGVEPVLIEGKTNAECLAIKATCDALYDQTELGYGVNAIEAWALGLPVIADEAHAEKYLELLLSLSGRARAQRACGHTCQQREPPDFRSDSHRPNPPNYAPRRSRGPALPDSPAAETVAPYHHLIKDQ